MVGAPPAPREFATPVSPKTAFRGQHSTGEKSENRKIGVWVGSPPGLFFESDPGGDFLGSRARIGWGQQGQGSEGTDF